MRRAAVLCVLLTASIGTTRAQSGAPKMEGYPEAGAPAIVKLLSPGSEPRTPLRLSVSPTYNEHFDMSMQMSMAMEMGGMAAPEMSIPAITVGTDVAVTNVAPNGDITFRVAFTGVTIGEGANPMIASALQGLDAQMKGMKGTATVSNRGISRSMKLEPGASADPLLGQMLGQMSNQVQSMSTPLPEEPIGVGARWEVRQAVNSGTAQMFQRIEYELAAFDGKTATLKLKLEQTAPPQSLSNPALPADAAMRLLAMNGSGTGATAARLDGLVWTGSTNIESAMSTEVSMGGNQQAINVKTSLKMTCAPAARK